MEHRKKVRKPVAKLLLAMAMIVAMGSQAYAGDLEALNIVGAEHASKEFTTTINESIRQHNCRHLLLCRR